MILKNSESSSSKSETVAALETSITITRITALKILLLGLKILLRIKPYICTAKKGGAVQRHRLNLAH